MPAAQYRRHLETTERELGPLRPGDKGSRSYLLFGWANALIREPAVLDVLGDLIGPDIPVTNLTTFAKAPRSPGFVTWHQDSTLPEPRARRRADHGLDRAVRSTGRTVNPAIVLKRPAVYLILQSVA